MMGTDGPVMAFRLVFAFRLWSSAQDVQVTAFAACSYACAAGACEKHVLLYAASSRLKEHGMSHLALYKCILLLDL